jgi:hypothetical protein
VHITKGNIRLCRQNSIQSPEDSYPTGKITAIRPVHTAPSRCGSERVRHGRFEPILLLSPAAVIPDFAFADPSKKKLPPTSQRRVQLFR